MSERHHCFYCGDDLGLWTKWSDRHDDCGAPECAGQARLDAQDEAATHLAHCDIGDYEGTCKYGDADCPVIKGR